ncbi:RNA-binding KH domain-containing protein PEPPER [Glycine soja]
MSQQGQIPINPMVPPQNPMATMQVPMPMHMQMQMQMQMPMPMHMPLPMQMQMQMPLPMPLQIPFSVQDTAPSSGKRRRDDENSGTAAAPEQSAAKRAKGQDVIFRIVVPSRQIGKVIGKEGHRIQKIREDTKATIKIADAIARHEERVIIISSKDNDEKVTDAEKALEQIAHLILKEDDSSLDASKVTAGHVAANTIRLLIAGSQAGGLIGMSGQNIEKLRDSSGASITVLAPNQLPLCASAHESDRVVQLSGDVPAVMKALEEIGCQLRENPPRQVISISPTYNYAAIRPSQPYLDPTSVDYVTFEMLISETMVGGLIGRCGSNISRIRNESGAMIKVYGGKGEQKHRQIQFGGSAQQVALAKQRVDEYIYSQLIQQTGTQQSVKDQSLKDSWSIQLPEMTPRKPKSLVSVYYESSYVASPWGAYLC